MEKYFFRRPGPVLADCAAEELPEIEKEALSAGFKVLSLDCGLMTGKAALMEHLASALSFPGDFGGNWDAAIDYLGDLHTIHGTARVLVLARAAQSLSGRDPKLYADFRETVAAACERMSSFSGEVPSVKFIFVK